MVNTVIRFKFIKYTIYILLLIIPRNNILIAQNNQLIKIVAFGNSTTAPRKGIERVYIERVHESLMKDGFNNSIINSGIGGSHTGSIKDNSFSKIEHAMDRLQNAVLDYWPNWVTLDFGLNDSWQDKGKDSTSRIPIEDFKKNLTYIIDKILAQNGKVILLTPNLIGKKFEKWRYNKVLEYKIATKKIALEKHIHWIDSWKLFSKYTKKYHTELDTLLLDGIHPNDIGHQIISDAITKIIEKSK
jgi:lysophospholipase L1-like esterase